MFEFDSPINILLRLILSIISPSERYVGYLEIDGIFYFGQLFQLSESAFQFFPELYGDYVSKNLIYNIQKIQHPNCIVIDINEVTAAFENNEQWGFVKLDMSFRDYLIQQYLS